MTTPSISARTVALGYSAPAADDLANYLRSSGIDRIALSGAIAITEPLRTAALAEIAQAIDGLLNISLAQVAVEGWCRYDKLACCYRAGVVMALVVEWLRSSGDRT
ncbi:hypothetical protein [Nocardia sp. NPDC005825]|uniref:hypothetical protein n=1 Tax=unclassified Nocardia TaxID=2637762 RepID=UPI0034115F7F